MDPNGNTRHQVSKENQYWDKEMYLANLRKAIDDKPQSSIVPAAARDEILEMMAVTITSLFAAGLPWLSPEVLPVRVAFAYLLSGQRMSQPLQDDLRTFLMQYTVNDPFLDTLRNELAPHPPSSPINSDEELHSTRPPSLDQSVHTLTSSLKRNGKALSPKVSTPSFFPLLSLIWNLFFPSLAR